jgi:hypothetical protein
MDELRVLISSARRRHEAGEAINLSEIQSRAQGVRQMAGRSAVINSGGKAELRQALNGLAADLQLLSDAIAASRSRLLNHMAAGEKPDAGHGPNDQQ